MTGDMYFQNCQKSVKSSIQNLQTNPIFRRKINPKPIKVAHKNSSINYTKICTMIEKTANQSLSAEVKRQYIKIRKRRINRGLSIKLQAPLKVL